MIPVLIKVVRVNNATQKIIHYIPFHEITKIVLNGTIDEHNNAEFILNITVKKTDVNAKSENYLVTFKSLEDAEEYLKSQGLSVN